MPLPNVYLDVCCLQRPFDDQSQDRIRLEAEAIILILARIEQGLLTWISSEPVDYEIARNPNLDRARKARLIVASAGANQMVGIAETQRAKMLQQLGFGGLDALHLACAESSGCEVFLTTDDKLLKRARRHASELQVRVVNPLTWLEEVMKQ